MKQLFSNNFTLVLLVFVSITFPTETYALSVEVDSVSQLRAAITTANKNGGNTTILLNDGIYTLSKGLLLSAPFITLQSKNSDRTKVTIEGDAMGPNASVGSLISISADNCSIKHLTLQKCRWHLVQIHGEYNADGVTIKDCILRDSYEQMVKVSVNPDNTEIAGDNGVVENCLFEYSAGIGPQWYIGGIDAHSAKNWVVRSNVFKNIISPSRSISEFAIHFWNHSANNLVERNLIINCDRGIGFGLGDRGNVGGIIRNNMIYHESDRGNYADTGIAIEKSPKTQIYNNTIFMEHTYPSAIEYRFVATKDILIANNLTNKPVHRRDNASGNLFANVTTAKKEWFLNTNQGNLHLNLKNIKIIIKSRFSVPELIDDFDGDLREIFAYIGADEALDN